MCKFEEMRSNLKPLLNTSRKSRLMRLGKACRLRIPSNLATPGSMVWNCPFFASSVKWPDRDGMSSRVGLPLQAIGPSSMALPPFTVSGQPRRARNFPKSDTSSLTWTSVRDTSPVTQRPFMENRLSGLAISNCCSCQPAAVCEPKPCCAATTTSRPRSRLP